MTPDENLTTDEQAQFDAMRSSDQSDASPVESAVPETPAQPASAATEPSETPEEPAKPDEPKRAQMVPHSALHEERERRKETEKQLQEERRRFTLALEKLNTPAQTQPQQPTAPEIPDFAQDPAGHILGTMRQTGMTVEQLAQVVQQQQEALQQRESIENLVRVGNIGEQQIRSEIPDYDAAVAYLMQKRLAEARIMGVANPTGWFNNLKLQWVRMHGEDAPRKAYELAKEMGYAPPTPAEAAPDGGAADKLARVEEGQRQARSLGGSRGTSPSAVPTAQRIAEMTAAQFDAWMSKASKEEQKAVLGA